MLSPLFIVRLHLLRIILHILILHHLTIGHVFHLFYSILLLALTASGANQHEYSCRVMALEQSKRGSYPHWTIDYHSVNELLGGVVASRTPVIVGVVPMVDHIILCNKKRRKLSISW